MATGYVLPEEGVTALALTTFPGMPGRFEPGVPLAVQHMGIEEEEADALIAELELPLEKASMSDAEAEAEIDRGDGHMPSGTEEVDVAPSPAEEDVSPEEEKPYSEWTVADLDGRFGHLEDYPASGSKADKVAFAEAQG